MADLNGPTATFATLTELESRVTMLEGKIAQFEKAYRDFLKNAEDNPLLRMAMGKLGITSDGSIG